MAAPGVSVKSVSRRRLISIVCEEFGISIDKFIGPRRDRQLSEARAVFCYIIRRRTEDTLMKLGELLNRDYTTVLHLSKKGDALIETCRETNDKYKEIIARAFGENQKNQINLFT